MMFEKNSRTACILAAAALVWSASAVSALAKKISHSSAHRLCGKKMESAPNGESCTFINAFGYVTDVTCVKGESGCHLTVIHIEGGPKGKPGVTKTGGVTTVKGGGDNGGKPIRHPIQTGSGIKPVASDGSKNGTVNQVNRHH
jgi:hypothetical protein